MALLKSLLFLFVLFAVVRAVDNSTNTDVTDTIDTGATDSSDTGVTDTSNDDTVDTGVTDTIDTGTTDTNAGTTNTIDTGVTDTSDTGITDTDSGTTDDGTSGDTSNDDSGAGTSDTGVQTGGTEIAPAQTVNLTDGGSYEVTVNVGDSVGFENSGDSTITITFADPSIPPVVIPPGGDGQTIPFTTPGDYTFTVTESTRRSLANRGKTADGKGKKGKKGKGKSELPPNSGVIHVIGDISATDATDDTNIIPIGKSKSKSGSKNLLFFVDKPESITHNADFFKQRALPLTALGLLMGGVALVAGVVLARRLSRAERKPLLPK